MIDDRAAHLPLRLYFHPLASFCHKVLIAFYENDVAFDPVVVDLGDEASRAGFKAIWPMGKMPVLRDEHRDRTVAESTIIIEYLDAHYGGATRFIPADPDTAWLTRMLDRFFDHYVHEPMQKIVTDRLRPAGNTDAYGVAQARAQLLEAYAFIDEALARKAWATGETFTLADCAAAPALFYANTVAPFGNNQKTLRSYLERLMARPSYARVLKEAEPYFRHFPLDKKPSVKRL
jgi:glutathione S-transferase